MTNKSPKTPEQEIEWRNATPARRAKTYGAFGKCRNYPLKTTKFKR